MRRGGKLSRVNVCMAILALGLRNLEEGVLALWQMTLCASYRGVAALERIRSRRMFLHGKSGRLETFHGVARGAFTAVGPRQKLAAVCILVAVDAVRMRHGNLEVSACMAIAALHCAMLSEQWELRF